MELQSDLVYSLVNTSAFLQRGPEKSTWKCLEKLSFCTPQKCLKCRCLETVREAQKA